MGTLTTLSELGPAATGLAAVTAGTIGSVTLRQRSRADRRDQWWKRTQWALDKTLLEDDASRALGYSLLNHLSDSRLADDEDRALLNAAARRSLDVDENGDHHG